MAEETPSKRNDALSVRRYYYKNRYYSPDLGRFIQRDLDGYTAGDSNLYRYVGNNPTNATDPSRLEELFKNQLTKRIPDYQKSWDNKDEYERHFEGKLFLVKKESGITANFTPGELFKYVVTKTGKVCSAPLK